jgi:cysteinyl-tRNA synthetase
MSELFLHNSQTRRREIFVPADPGNVRVYVCGPTVYDLPHLGNVRAFTNFDVLVRLLRLLYPRVTYVRNITDVDDKINARAAESGEPIAALTARTGADFQSDMAAIGNMPPDVQPCATAHIAEMITVIEKLIAGGHAYAAEGHVLFSVGSFAQYGALSGRSPDELMAGARVEVAAYKRDAGDFVEAVGDGFAGVGKPVGARAAGLAYRVQCDVLAVFGREFRYTWRRQRFAVSAS